MTFLGDLCHDAVPGFLGLFDLSIAPSLLFYSYIPIITASATIGFYVFYKDKRSLKSRLLLTVTLFFVLWVINILVQWVGAYNTVIMLGWQLTAIFEVGMFLTTAYFVRVFLYEKDISFTEKIVFFVVSAVTLAVIPTSLNVTSYDIVNCEGVNGFLWNIIYAFEPAIIVLIAWWGLNAYRLEENRARRKQIFLFIVGVVLFLTTFFISNYYGELIKMYEFNLWGPIGMVIFLVLLGYMIVRYQTFNIKLIATQALVVATMLLLGSLFFSPNIYVIAATFVAFSIGGVFIIQSVKREIKLREELEVSNKWKESLIHAMNHQIKGYLGVARNVFAELLTTDYGQMPEQSKPLMTHGLEEMGKGVEYVKGILNSISAHGGMLQYEMKPVDLKFLISDLVSQQKEVAEKAGLSFESAIADGDYTVSGDATKLEEVFKNLITNAILYNNPHGNVAVSLSHTDGKILFTVKDTGVGISKDDEKRLFKPGGMGKDSIKHNANASGYGLAFVEPVIKEHHGKIWYETEVGKGTTFFVELPVKQVS